MHSDKDWVAIAALVPSKTKVQFYNRWRDAVNPSIALKNRRTCKWTEDDDLKLKNAVRAHGGKNWEGIAALVPGRTKVQCANRWRVSKG
jgi:hypothetical protein